MKNIELSKVYSPKDFEERIYKKLLNEGYYNPDNSNSDKTLTLSIYTQGDFSAPLYRIKDGVRYYRDVEFTFVSR